MAEVACSGTDVGSHSLAKKSRSFVFDLVDFLYLQGYTVQIKVQDYTPQVEVEAQGLVFVDNENCVDFEVDFHDQVCEVEEAEVGRL